MGWAIIPCLYIHIQRMTVPLGGKGPWVILRGGKRLPVLYFVQMGLLVLHGYVGGVIYYGDTLWILGMGSCLTLLGPTCLWLGLDSTLCSYRTQALPGDVCLWRCRMNWSRLASHGEDVFCLGRAPCNSG